MTDVYNSVHTDDEYRKIAERREEIFNNTATMITTATRLFWPGILFLIAGYSDFADEFCLSFIDPLQKPSESMLGPEGKIVQWNRVMAALHLIGALMLIVAAWLYNNVSPVDSKESVPPKMIFILQGIRVAYLLVVFVYTCIGMEYIFSYETPIACRRTHEFQDKIPYVVLWVFSVIYLVLYSVLAAFVAMVLLYIAFISNPWAKH